MIVTIKIGDPFPSDENTSVVVVDDGKEHYTLEPWITVYERAWMTSHPPVPPSGRFITKYKTRRGAITFINRLIAEGAHLQAVKKNSERPY